MAKTTLKRILEKICTLQTDELQTVEEAIRTLLEPAAKENEREAVLRALHETGLVHEIKRPSIRTKRTQKPVPIQGQPISETIIEERQ